MSETHPVGWERATYTDKGTGHIVGIEIIPIDDLEPHISSEACICCPKFDRRESIPMLIHNAFDGREKTEKLRAQ